MRHWLVWTVGTAAFLALAGCDKLPNQIDDMVDDAPATAQTDLSGHDTRRDQTTGDTTDDLALDTDTSQGDVVDVLDMDVLDPDVADIDVADTDVADPNDASDALDTDTVDVPPPDPSCADYCAALSTACVGDNAQYPDEAACLTACTSIAWPMGTTGELTGNTVGCRLQHAVLAATGDPATHCPHAGLSGGGVCGSWCESYCALTAQHCTDWSSLFVDSAACAASCGLLPDDGEAMALDGNTAQCRINHAALAGGTGDALTHCAEASPQHTSACVGPATGGGEDCAAATVLVGVPGFDSGDTSSASDDISSMQGCPGVTNATAAGADVVYQFTPPTSAAYRLELTGAPPLLYVVTDCADVATTCLGAIDTTESDALWLTLDAGTTYSVVVDGRDTLDSGAFSLRVSEPCAPACDAAAQCGGDGCGGVCGQCTDPDVCDLSDQLCKAQAEVAGDTCAAPFVAPGLPFSMQADTRVGTTNTLQAVGCGIVDTTGAAEPDHVYAFTVPTWVYQLVVDPQGYYDAALYVTADCSVIDGTTCAGGADGFEGGGTETLTLPLTSGTWYAVVDGFEWFAGAGAGAYSLSISPVAASCALYCETVTTRCVEGDAQYVDEATCLDACAAAGWPIGAPASSAGDTLSCRLVQAIEAGAAGADVAVSCAAAGLSGGTLCVAP